MDNFDGPVAAADAVRRFFYVNEDSLPDIVRDKVAPLVGSTVSSVDVLVGFVESAWANRADMTAEGLALAAGCAMLIYQSGFHNSLDGRAVAMVPALRRESGEEPPADATWPDTDADPAIDQAYAVQPVVVPVPLP